MLRANSSQAKGPVERFNAKFFAPPARPENLHREINLSRKELRDIVCRREMRYVGLQLSLSWIRGMLILERKALTDGLVGKYVEIFDPVRNLAVSPVRSTERSRCE